jgi:hypothetical protein
MQLSKLIFEKIGRYLMPIAGLSCILCNLTVLINSLFGRLECSGNESQEGQKMEIADLASEQQRTTDRP